MAILPDRLREGALPMRFIRVVRPDQQGRFETRGLPPGDYLVAAVETLEGGQWDPAFRKKVEPRRKRFRLVEGQTVSLDLQLIQSAASFALHNCSCIECKVNRPIRTYTSY